MLATTAKYPDFLPQVKGFVEQHRKLKHDKLLLAVYFAPPHRAKRDIYILEVKDRFGRNEVDPTRKLFEFAYGSTPALPLPSGSRLQMILTNPAELQQAVKENWKGIEKVRKARADDRATVVFADPRGKRLWDLLK